MQICRLKSLQRRIIYTLIGIGHSHLFYISFFVQLVNANNSTVCGADASYDNSASLLTYKSRVSTDISSSSIGGIVVKPAMASAELTCKYAQTVDGPVSISSIASFTGADVASETGSVGDDQITCEPFIMNGDTSESVTTGVTLGSQIKVSFLVGNKDMPIYVKSCQAKKDANTDDSADFYIVENGCDKTLAQIKPEQKAASCDADTCSVELWFEQFGFVVTGTTGTTFKSGINNKFIFRNGHIDFSLGVYHCLRHGAIYLWSA